MKILTLLLSTVKSAKDSKEKLKERKFFYVLILVKSINKLSMIALKRLCFQSHES